MQLKLIYHLNLRLCIQPSEESLGPKEKKKKKFCMLKEVSSHIKIGFRLKTIEF